MSDIQTVIYGNQLEKQNAINKNNLDRGLYFQSLFQEVCNKKLLSKAQIERIQLEIVELMSKEVDRYNSGESSSIRIEKAQDLLQSITYCIGAYLKSIEDMEEVLNLLKNEKVSVLFYKGMDTVSDIKSKAAMLLQNLQNNMVHVNNIAYQDTLLNGIPEFFHDYNIEFGGHEMPGYVDYPILETITELLGVEYLYEYLQYLTIENDFLSNFKQEYIQLLLNGFDKESDHMLVNLFELVLNNVIGCKLIGLDICDLNISEDDCSLLQDKVKNMNKEALYDVLEKVLEAVGKELDLQDEILDYSRKAIPNLVTRIYNSIKSDTLSKVFLSFRQRIQKAEPFIDGVPMEDEELRKLINVLSGMTSTSKKIERIQEEVHSLYDLIEVLNECFYESEYEKVLDLLNNTEKTVLKQRILEDAGEENIKDFNPDQQWHKVLFKM